MTPLNVEPSRRIFKWIAICAVLGVLAGMLWPAAQQSAAQTPTPPPAHGAVATPSGTYRGPEYCGTAKCHPQEYSLWKSSRHSVYSITPSMCTTCHTSPSASGAPTALPRPGVSLPPAATPTSQADTAAHSKGGNCAACHTTGYDPATGRSIAEGVTCEACHGLSSESHPPSKMTVSDEAAFCGACHQPSFSEWQMSRHGYRNIKCTACHDVHSQRLRFESANKLCANCHGDRYNDFAHSTHSANGLNCTNCHIYRVASRSEMGRAPTGHTFRVTSVVCANCHKDSIHQVREISQLEEKIVQLQDLVPHSTVERINQLQDQVAALERSRLPMLGSGGAVGALVGVIVGGVGAYWVARRKSAPARPTAKTARTESKKAEV